MKNKIKVADIYSSGCSESTSTQQKTNALNLVDSRGCSSTLSTTRICKYNIRFKQEKSLDIWNSR